MPHTKKTHQYVLANTCVICLRKGDRPLTEAQRQAVNTYVFKDFLQHSVILPASICGSCRQTLSSQGNPDSQKRRLPPPPAYNRMVADLSVLSGGTSEVCPCDLCRIATAFPSRVQHPVSISQVPFPRLDGRKLMSLRHLLRQCSHAPTASRRLDQENHTFATERQGFRTRCKTLPLA